MTEASDIDCPTCQHMTSWRCGAGPTDEGESERAFQYEKAEGLLPGQTVDPAFDGFLLTTLREGETSRPDLEASAIALGLCWRDGMGSLCLTAAGRRRLRDARLI